MLFHNKNVLKITNYKKILEFSDTIITTLTLDHLITIKGANLAIIHFTKEEIIIHGNVININLKSEEHDHG